MLKKKKWRWRKGPIEGKKRLLECEDESKNSEGVEAEIETAQNTNNVNAN